MSRWCWIVVIVAIVVIAKLIVGGVDDYWINDKGDEDY